MEKEPAACPKSGATATATGSSEDWPHMSLSRDTNLGVARSPLG